MGALCTLEEAATAGSSPPPPRRRLLEEPLWLGPQTAAARPPAARCARPTRDLAAACTREGRRGDEDEARGVGAVGG